jgi:hypothetical protein
VVPALLLLPPLLLGRLVLLLALLLLAVSGMSMGQGENSVHAAALK